MDEKSLDIFIRIIAQEVGQEKADQILKRVTEETNKGTTATAEHTGKVHGLNKAVGMLGHQFGELGRLAHFAFSGSGVALAIAALAIGLGKLIGYFADLKKKTEEAATALEKLKTDKMDALRAATAQATTGMHQFNEEMRHAGDPGDEIKAAFDKRKALYDAEVKATEKLIEAQEDLAIARAKASGDKEGEQAAQKRKEDRKAALAVEADKGKFTIVQEERAARIAAQEDLNIDAGNAKAAALNLPKEESLITAKLKLAEVQGKQEQLAKAARPYTEEMLASLRMAVEMGAEGAGPELTKGLAARTAEQNNEAAITANQAIITGYATKQYDADQEAARREAKANTNAARTTELGTQVGTERAAGIMGAGVRGLGEARDVAGRVRAGGQVSHEEQDLLRIVGSNIAGQNVNVKTAAAMMKSAEQNPAIMQNFLDRILTAMEQNQGVSSSLVSRLSQVEGQLSSLRNGPR